MQYRKMERKDCLTRQRGDLCFWVKNLVGAIDCFSTHFPRLTWLMLFRKLGIQLIFIKALHFVQVQLTTYTSNWPQSHK